MSQADTAISKLSQAITSALESESRLFVNLVPSPVGRGVLPVTTDNGLTKVPGQQTLWFAATQTMPIGIKTVERAHGWRVNLQVDRVVIVSDKAYTKNAIGAAAELRVELMSLSDFLGAFSDRVAAPEPVSEARVEPVSQESALDKQFEEEQLQEAIDLLGKLHSIDRSAKLAMLYARTFEENGHNFKLGGPYKWQVDYHNSGGFARERGLIAANRVGKTQCAAAEVAIHMTGKYPSWWQGRRFATPIRAWVGSDTNETSRDIVQASLLGDEVGTGWIPADKIVSVENRQCGISNVIDTLTVRHVSGGVSKLVFKTYEQGRKKWQGTSQHLIWLDEEPPQDIYTEAQTRTLDVQGTIMLTFTPLSGASDVVLHLIDGGEGIYCINVTWDDAPHLDEASKRQMLMSYPEWERDTRSKGVPLAGSGVVYPVSDDDIICDPFEIPDHFVRNAGADFGIDHPGAGAWLAWDRDKDIIYVYDCYRMRGQTAAYHVDAFKTRGEWIPIAWPHDGMQREKSSGEPLAAQWKAKGANMMPESARYDDESGGPQPTEPVVLEIDERMRTGRFKVFKGLEEWFREKRMYHRKDGLIVREHDDIMAATQYAVMMKRFARTKVRRTMSQRAADFDPFSFIGGAKHGSSFQQTEGPVYRPSPGSR